MSDAENLLLAQEQDLTEQFTSDPRWFDEVEEQKRRGIFKRGLAVFAGMATVVGSLGVGGKVTEAEGQEDVVSAKTSECINIPIGEPGDTAVLNITNTDTQPGHGALRASNETPLYNRPESKTYSHVNFGVAEPPNPNLGFATIGPDGKICYDQGPGNAHTILDLYGVFPAGTFESLNKRLLDTRQTISSGESLQLVSTKNDNYVMPNEISASCVYEYNPYSDLHIQTLNIMVDGIDPDSTPNNNNSDGGWVGGSITNIHTLGGEGYFHARGNEHGEISIGSVAFYSSVETNAQAKAKRWSGLLNIFKWDAYEFDIPESETGKAVYRIELDCK